MSRNTEQRIRDILQSIARCQRYVDALDSEDSNTVDMAKDALERNLQIIGEAANTLPQEFTSAHPEIASPQIRGFRYILVHQYLGVDKASVRDVIDMHLPFLPQRSVLPRNERPGRMRPYAAAIQPPEGLCFKSRCA